MGTKFTQISIYTPVQGRVTSKYLESTLAETGDLYARMTHHVYNQHNKVLQSRLTTTRPVVTLIGYKAVAGVSRYFGR